MNSVSGIGSLSSSQISALNRLNELSSAIAVNSQRLSTLKRINTAKDDPAGLVASSILQRELTAAETASKNVTRASAMIGTADSSLGEIVGQLQEARALALQSAGGGLTAAEDAANQIELDIIINQINNLAGVEFGGKRLFDGSSSYRAQGVDPDDFVAVTVLEKSTDDDVTVDVEITAQATQATDSFSGVISADTTITVEGPDGSAVISLDNGASHADIVDAFNAVAHLTGIDAVEDVGNSEVDLTTAAYGSDAEINITVIEGSFTTDGGNSVAGTDAEATINGQSVTADGTTFNVSTGGTQLEIIVDASANGSLTSFQAVGEGLSFAVGTSAASTMRVGIPMINTARLGGVDGNLHDLLSGNSADLLGGNGVKAVRILDDALEQVTLAQGRIGAFEKNGLEPAGRLLDSQMEHLSAALSSVQDANVAVETALLANNQLMQQTTLQALSISNLQRQSVLNLLQSSSLF